MRDYQKILEFERNNCVPEDHTKRIYELGSYFQGQYRRDNPADNEAETLRRAHAVAYMLEHLPLSLSPDQEFFGGTETFKTVTLPSEITLEEYEECLACYKAQTGLRTFREGADHVAIDNERLIREGLPGFIARAEAGCREHGTSDAQAMLVVLLGLKRFFERAAEACQSERPEVAQRLINLTKNKPETFEEGLQLIWLLFVLVEADGPRHHNALARIDQYLIDLYYKSAPGRERALECLCQIWSKVEGFHEVTNICIGGVKPDGTDAVNELSFLVLEATKLVQSASTNLSARLSSESSDEFVLACVDLISTGIGFPAIFNDNVNIKMLTNLGFPVEAARDYALFGCVEPLVAGRQVAWSDGRFSMPESFLKAVMRLEEFDSYEELWAAFASEMHQDMIVYADSYNRALEAMPSTKFPDPLLSALVRDCLGRGRDINDGGAEFPRFHGVGMMGIATITDGLAAIKKLVFEERRILAADLVAALKGNFDTYEELQATLLNCAPKYGNDDEYCDNIAQEVVKLCAEVCLEQSVSGGGFLLSCMASNISNIPAGAALGATPDGRLAGFPISDAASPVGGRDHLGPTAFINSIVKPDYTGQACTVVNMRFQPEFFKSEAGQRNMLALLRGFIAGGGQEIQFNVTGQEILVAAQKEPEKYADLLIRVSGFSAYFVRLEREVQNDILRRTIHHES